MALEVIGAGFGRTGTSSLKEALEQLGFGTCHHMFEVLRSDEQIAYWSDIANGEQPDWDTVFEGFGASVDWPSARYYKELAEHYPDAKVVLSVRDAEKWYTSVMETIYPLSGSIPWILYTLRPAMRTWNKMVFKLIWDGIFDGRMDDKDHVIGVFKENIEQVKRSIPPERLLIHEAKDGWEPLCEFFGKPVPDTPYPRTNDTAEMKKRINQMRVVSGLQYFVIGILFAVITYFVTR